MQAIGLGNYCFEVHSTRTQKSSVLEQLATAWRERNLVTEEHWSTAAGISDRTKGTNAIRNNPCHRWFT